MNRYRFSSLLSSLALHAAILLLMYSIKLVVLRSDQAIVLDTFLPDEEREQIEVVQELDIQTEIPKTLNIIPGSVSTKVGGSDAPLSRRTKVEDQELLQDPELKVNIADIEVPAVETLGDDLGEEQVTGEIGALVEGYGPALDRLTQELIRLMRKDKLLVVWLFDESKSMKDDQQEIKKRFHRVYEELKLYHESAVSTEVSRKERTPARQEIMLSSIASFGSKVHVQTPRPTADIEQIMAAIDRIPVEPNGEEMMCTALLAMVQKYREVSFGHNRRKLVLIVISDESGDDELKVEAVLNQIEPIKAPIYILGRESVFGSLYAHVRWRQPETGYLFYLPVRRGPETAFAEQLQFDGYRRRTDSHMSGFGPYAQVRLARNSGGIFFQLPYEQENLNDFEDKKYEWLRLKEYAPSLDSRREYLQTRQNSRFRRAVWDVIVMLNPYEKNSILELPDPVTTRERFTMNASEYGPVVRSRIRDILKILRAMRAAEEHLESVRELYDREPSVRWRANYDLISAQLPWYRVRLLEYALGLDQFTRKKIPEIQKEKPKHNRWFIVESSSSFIVPDKQQEKLLGIDAEDLIQARDEAKAKLAAVRELHPDTPWSKRAEWELRRSFGVQFRSYYRAPPSNTPRRPMPQPTPPPKL